MGLEVSGLVEGSDRVFEDNGFIQDAEVSEYPRAQ